MAIALSLRQYLSDHQIPYDVLVHEATGSAGHAAEAAHVPGDKMAKGVLLSGSDGYMLAVLPASHHLRMDLLNDHLGDTMRLATEEEIGELFRDCERGAVPACAPAYGLRAVVDDTLGIVPDVYMEAGDHRSLLHLDGEAFHRMLGTADHARISMHD
ncbi:aminoacyl-tRNA deacylase [Novispirillum sp. DQ9]|uniref:aminoacyl-tRNA deacylase n=1 Tax=Novispirillum sp. DQ9 TaxID=3398612 RepID=UPI003C7AC7BD